MKAWEIPPPLKGSEWANKYFKLTADSGSSESGDWECLAFQREILDVMSDDEHETVDILKSSRVGYTKMICAKIGMNMHYDVRSTLVVQPTDEDAEGFSKDEIATMLDAVPVLRGLVREAKKSNSNNTIKKKKYPGGILHIIGGTSPKGFRRITVDTDILDEWDGYPLMAGDDGAHDALSGKRTVTSAHPKHIRGSTPTLTSTSRIVPAYESSDMRKYYVPCPHCQFYQKIEFKNLHWDKTEDAAGNKIHHPETAHLVCVSPACGAVIEEAYKQDMIDAGEWRAERPEVKNHAGFFIWAGYSPFPGASWAKIAKEFIDAAADKDPQRAKMIAFTNTTLGEAWDDTKDENERDHTEISGRAEPYSFGTVPAEACYLLVTVDTQNDRLEVKTKAYGPIGEDGDFQSWIVDYESINGDPKHVSTTETPSVWARLDEFLAKEYEHEHGSMLKIRACGIDTQGGRTQSAYDYAARKDHPCPVYAFKGSSNKDAPLIPNPKKKPTYFRTKAGRRGKLYLIGVHRGKDEVDANLTVTDPAPGFMHFSEDCDEAYFQGLVAEYRDYKWSAGQRSYVWKCPKGKRNEPLDLEVYQLALFRLVKPDLEYEMAKLNLAKDEDGESGPPESGENPPPEQHSGGFNTWGSSSL